MKVAVEEFMPVKYFCSVEEFIPVNCSLWQLLLLRCHFCSSKLVVPHGIPLLRIIFARSFNSVLAISTKRNLNTCKTCVAIHNQRHLFQTLSGQFFSISKSFYI